MSLPDSIAGPWHVLIPINISESHHPLITNFEVFISFTNCYFFFILTVSRTRKEYQNFLKKFNGKNELNVSSIRMKMDEMCFSSLRFVFVFLLFFLPFFFHFPKKKAIDQRYYAGRTSWWCTKLAHRILSIDSERYWCWVELEPYYTIRATTNVNGWG